jgi:Protein of unknown function (DUF4058)
MPSPFPGMDPFLEDPRRWADFHHRFITICSDFLLAAVRPKYYVQIEERVYISNENDATGKERIPDIQVVTNPDWAGGDLDTGGTAVEIAERVVAEARIRDDVREARLEIIDRENQLVVTVIEVLGPSNKSQASQGRTSFELKRQEVMRSTSHWVEIDLLRGGVGVEMVDPLPLPEYLIYLSRVDMRPYEDFWPIRLSQRLPVIPIPLNADDPDVSLDIQAVFSTVYDRAGYDFTIDYAKAPFRPLQSELAAWADRLLRDKGLRTG